VSIEVPENPMSENKNWRPMVEVDGRDWVGNSLVFATKEEAEENALSLKSRWLSVTNTRADPTEKPVNCPGSTAK
jgi:hypothetical protein